MVTVRYYKPSNNTGQGGGMRNAAGPSKPYAPYYDVSWQVWDCHPMTGRID
jgi:hypothetical protein